MMPISQAVLYTRDPVWSTRVKAYCTHLLQLQVVDQEEELERVLDMLSPTLLILDMRTKNARNLPVILRQRWPETLIIACGKDRSDPIQEARMAGVYGTVDFDISAQGFKDLLSHSQDYLNALRMIHILQERQQPTAPTPTSATRMSGTPASWLKPMAPGSTRDARIALILDRCAAATGSLRLGLFLRPAQTDSYQLAGDQNASPFTREQSYPPDHPLPKWLRTYAQIIHRDHLPASIQPKEQSILQQALEQMSATLILPLLHAGELTGWIFCSGAADGHHFTGEELQTFIVLTQYAAQALAQPETAPPPLEPHAVTTTVIPEEAPIVNMAITEQGALEELASDDELWSDLATSMAHEIRNPLVAIKTFSQLLPERFDDADFRGEFSRLVADEVERLNHTVEEINTFAHPPELIFKDMALSRIIENAVQRVRRDTHKKQLPVTITDSTSSVHLHGDERALSECLAHIILNAIEATRHQEHPIVKISIQQTASHEVLIMVADNGQGIPQELQHKLFSPFCTTKARGLGLGLPVARRTILRHGGDLTIDPSPEGTIVTLSLPLLTAEQNTYETPSHC